MKNFIIIALDDLILAHRIYLWIMILFFYEEFYRWTILLLHEDFIVKWFYSYMKNFIVIALDDLILAQRIYC